MEKLLEINSLSLAIFGASIYGILKHFYDGFQSTMEADIKRKTTLNDGVLALLHGAIFAKGCEYLKRGSVSVAELNDLEKMYDPYERMGGNSTAKIIMENVRKLPIIDEKLELIEGVDD